MGKEKGRSEGRKKDDEKSSSRKEKIKGSAKQLGIDVVIALVIVGVVMGGLYLYSGIWPPLVVVESRSMQHSNSDSYVGVIDTGDLVVVRKPASLDEITTYVKGRNTGYSTYGEFGDVVVYRKYGSTTETPVIHRAILYANYDPSSGLFNVPELQGLTCGKDKDWARDGSCSSSWSSISMLTLYHVGYSNKTININLRNFDRYSGFVTLGDNGQTNQDIDQVGIIPNKMIKFDWIVGMARGELPWFGLIKLCLSGSSDDKLNCGRAPQNSVQGVWVALGVLVLMPVMYDIARTYVSRKREELEKGEASMPSGQVAAILNLLLPGTGYMYSAAGRWAVVGAYVLTLYFFPFEILVAYALGFPLAYMVGLLAINCVMAGHVFYLLRKKVNL